MVLTVSQQSERDAAKWGNFEHELDSIPRYSIQWNTLPSLKSPHKFGGTLSEWFMEHHLDTQGEALAVLIY